MPTTTTKTTTVKKTTAKRKKRQFSIGILTPLTQKNSADFLCQAFEIACELGIEVSLLAEGDQSSQERCFEIAEKHHDSFTMLESSTKNREKILKNSSILLFAQNPGKKLINEALAENIPMVLPEGCGMENFNPQKESGEAFTFEEGNKWQFVAAMIRASENYKFTYDWNTLKKNLAKV